MAFRGIFSKLVDKTGMPQLIGSPKPLLGVLVGTITGAGVFGNYFMHKPDLEVAREERTDPLLGHLDGQEVIEYIETGPTLVYVTRCVHCGFAHITHRTSQCAGSREREPGTGSCSAHGAEHPDRDRTRLIRLQTARQTVKSNHQAGADSHFRFMHCQISDCTS